MTEQPTVEGERTRIDRGDRREVRIEGLANGGKVEATSFSSATRFPETLFGLK